MGVTGDRPGVSLCEISTGIAVYWPVVPLEIEPPPRVIKKQHWVDLSRNMESFSWNVPSVDLGDLMSGAARSGSF